MQNRPENSNIPIFHPQQPPYGWMMPYEPEEEINLLDYFRVFKKHLGKIILMTLLFTSLVATAGFLMTKKYKAEVSLMPLAQSGASGGLAALASQVSSLPLVGGQLSGLAGLAGGNQKTGQILSILKSRTLTEKLVNQFDLMHVIYKKRWDPEKNAWKPNLLGETPTLEDAVKYMRKKVLNIQDDKKTGLIKIDVELKDPVLAANVANRMIVELQDFISKNQFTVAKRNRIFIEEQLQENKVDLLESGKKLSQFYSENRISSIQPRLDVDVGKIVGPPKPFEEFRDDLSALKQQKEEIDSKMAEAEKSGMVQNVPSQVYLQYLTLQRELLGRVNALLTQQYELAKIEEAKEDLTFQVIDPAVPPVRHSKPQKLIMTAIGFMGGFFLSVFLAFFLEYLDKLRKLEASRRP